VDTVFSGGGHHVDPSLRGLWITGVGGANARIVLRGPIGVAELSPDRSQIVLSSGGSIYRGNVVNDTIASNSVALLTTRQASFFPTWSPSGSEVAFDNTDCGSAFLPNECGIYIVRDDGTDERFVIRGRMPDWHPSASQILFVGLDADLYLVDATSPVNSVRLLALDEDVRTPRYCADGATIAFTVLERGGPVIWLVDADGSNPRPLVQGEWPAWSPAGELIAFSRPSRSDPTDNGTLWAIRVADRVTFRLTSGLGGP
jgi:Tol biopolymer transport system component